MVLQVVGLVAGRLRLPLLQRKNSVVKDLTESVVIEVANGHLCIFALRVQVLLHLLKHLFLLARAHPLLESLVLFNLLTLLVRVERQLLVKNSALSVLPVAFLELGFDFFKACLGLKQSAEGCTCIRRPVLLMVVSLLKLQLEQVRVWRKSICEQVEAVVCQNSNVQLLERRCFICSVEDSD